MHCRRFRGTLASARVTTGRASAHPPTSCAVRYIMPIGWRSDIRGMETGEQVGRRGSALCLDPLRPTLLLLVAGSNQVGNDSSADLENSSDQAACITPLVVVPGEDLDKITVNHLGKREVDNRGMRIADKIG